MSETLQHARMVQAIVTWAVETYGSDSGLCIFRDAADAPPGSKPPAIAGFVPDVLARTVPASFVMIGEAKWYRDLESRRSQSQLRAYMEYLALQQDPQLVLASPWALAGRSRMIVRQAARSAGAEHVPVVFLHF